jgi:CheY-like chemotaxis protein
MIEGKNLTALVVDDYADSRRILRRMLELRRVRVIEASGGAEAVEAARRECPELIFLDLYMPGVDGLEAGRKIRELKGLCDDAVLIAYSAYDSPELRSETMEVGFNRFIVKPLDFDELDKILLPFLPTR